ncbi:MAG: hypothetical protein JWQ03_3084 [Variovorax sp.]|nr:hypothetical protein [Variovorax sp.]
MTETQDICAHCFYYHDGAPPIASATRNPLGASGVGTCQILPPVMVVVAGVPYARFPEVAAERTCGEWEPNRFPDDDGGENVVPLRPAA